MVAGSLSNQRFSPAPARPSGRSQRFLQHAHLIALITGTVTELPNTRTRVGHWRLEGQPHAVNAAEEDDERGVVRCLAHDRLTPCSAASCLMRCAKHVP